MINVHKLNSIEATIPERYSTGIDGVDLSLNGGIVRGSTVLLSGTTGAGKSTLLTQISHYIANHLSKHILYVAGEENKEQIKMRAKRLKIDSDKIFILEEIELEKIIEAKWKLNPDIIIVDSLQTIYSNKIKRPPMTPTQMKHGLLTLCKLAKSTNTTVIFVGHATKGGYIAGLQALQHLVDTVIFMKIDDDMPEIRHFVIKKNRFGNVEHEWQFIMTDMGAKDRMFNEESPEEKRKINLDQDEINTILKGHSVWGTMVKASLSWLYDQQQKKYENKIYK